MTFRSPGIPLYKDYLARWNSSRKYKGTVRSGGHRNVRFRFDKEDNVVLLHGTTQDVLGTLTHSNVFTVADHPIEFYKNARGAYWAILGLNVYAQKHGRLQTWMRCYPINVARSVPFKGGMQFKLEAHIHRATLVDLNMAEDKVMHVKPEVRKLLQQRMAGLTAKCHVLQRMDAYDMPSDRYSVSFYERIHNAKASVHETDIDKFDFDAFPPHLVFDLGLERTLGVWRVGFSPEHKRDFAKRAVANGLRWLREYWYRRLDGYELITRKVK